MKTALTELIEHLNYFKDHSAFARDAIKKATALLKKEREQISNAYIQGRKDDPLDWYPEKHAEEYFMETFNNKP